MLIRLVTLPFEEARSAGYHVLQSLASHAWGCQASGVPACIQLFFLAREDRFTGLVCCVKGWSKVSKLTGTIRHSFDVAKAIRFGVLLLGVWGFVLGFGR